MYKFQNEYCYLTAEGVAVTNTRIIAEKAGRDHKAILKNFNPESRDCKGFLVAFLCEGGIPPTYFEVTQPNGGVRQEYMYEFTEGSKLPNTSPIVVATHVVTN